jgi:hypothetical protein
MDIPRSDSEIQKLLAEKKERLKELSCINQTTQIIKEGKMVEETLRRITYILPNAWQFPNHTVARIRYGEFEFTTHNFRETAFCQMQHFKTIDNIPGSIDIYYLKEFPEIDEGPFLKEERNLINNLASIISNYLNTIEARNNRVQKRKIYKQPQIIAEIPEQDECQQGYLPRPYAL